MYTGRIPSRMRIKQAAWKSSVGVRELSVWQRDCQHFKIARVLNKTETCTIYTCHGERKRRVRERVRERAWHEEIVIVKFTAWSSRLYSLCQAGFSWRDTCSVLVWQRKLLWFGEVNSICLIRAELWRKINRGKKMIRRVSSLSK